MLIMMLMLVVAVLPLLTGIYYATTGYAKKRRQTFITGMILIILWAIIMYYVSDKFYHLYASGE
jgi:uncharacterized membrane protein